MRIGTWNIGGGFVSSKTDGKFDTDNLDYFIDGLKKAKCDIVCLQEAECSKDIALSQTAYIAESSSQWIFLVRRNYKRFSTYGNKISAAFKSAHNSCSE